MQLGVLPSNDSPVTITGNLFDCAGGPSNNSTGVAYYLQDSAQGMSSGALNITYNRFTNCSRAGFRFSSPGVALNVTDQTINLNYNSFVNNTDAVKVDSVSGTALTFAGSTVVDVTNNWWGCNEGPGATGCDEVVAGSNTADSDPWLVLTASVSASQVAPGHIVDVTADITTNSDGQSSGGYVPDGSEVDFASISGILTPASATTASGIAESAFTAGSTTGNTAIDVTLDNATVSVPIDIEQAATGGSDGNENGGSHDSGGSNSPSQSFVGDDVSAGTGGAITLDSAVNKATNGAVTGNVYGTPIVVDGQFIADPATIGIPELLRLNIKQAVNLFGLLPGGVSTFDFVSPVTVCLRGSGPVFFVDAETHTVQNLPGTPSGEYTCVQVPAAGIVILDPTADGAPAPAAISASPISASLANCHVTTEYRVNLRSAPSLDASVVTQAPFNQTLQVTERSGGWYKVIYGDAQYYVSADLVTSSGTCG
jgi:hypothetical protein